VFLDLNEAAQWASLAASLTLPVPGLPRFKTVGWRNATIEWETKNKPDRHDKTKFGFVLDICKANARDDCFKEIVEKAALKVRTLEVNGKPVHIFSTLLSKFIEPDTSYLARCVGLANTFHAICMILCVSLFTCESVV
jgi:hypothetical protein